MHIFYFIICFLTFCSYGFAKVNLDPAQIQRLINTLHNTHHLPGIQVGVKDTETGQLWNFSSGYRDKERLDPLENHHLMQIGSTTKSFIASLALLLEADSENGVLGVTFNIDQTIGDWLPHYSKWKHIKIKNLLNMTSGIYNYTDDNGLFLAILQDPVRIWQDSELVALAYSHDPSILFPLGAKYFYSNTNYILVGMILEKVTGLSLETLMKERILKKYPEHFKSTSYSPKAYPQAERLNMAHGYAMDPKGILNFMTKISQRLT